VDLAVFRSPLGCIGAFQSDMLDGQQRRPPQAVSRMG
jgi:hypothetical protein